MQEMTMVSSKPAVRGTRLPVVLLPVLAILLVCLDARAQTDASAANVARLELRIAELETQIRNLTGQIERLSFDLRQANDRLDRAMTDTEYRLTTLEGGTPGGAAAPSTGAAAAQVSADQPNDAPAGNALQPSGQAPQAGDAQVLGTLTVNSEGATTGAAAGAAQPQAQVAAAAPTNPNADIATRYNDAFALLQGRDFAGAESAFNSFIDSYPNHPLASNARYWVGESLYARGQFPEAASSFALGYQQYPDGAKALDSLVKLGMTFAAMGQKQDACATFGQIDVEFPSAPQGVLRRVAQEVDRLQCG